MLSLLTLLFCQLVQAQPDPLPSWNAGQHKQAIIAFVQAVTIKSSPEFVPPEERRNRSPRC